MNIIVGLFSLLLFILACKWLSKFFFRIGKHLEEKEKYNRYHDRIIRESLTDIRDSLVTPEDNGLNEVERLLQANQKITEKKDFKNAMEKELGIF